MLNRPIFFDVAFINKGRVFIFASGLVSLCDLELFQPLSAQPETVIYKYIDNMRKSFGILLAALITLMLGLSPLQGAIAGFSDSFDQRGDARLIADAIDSGFTVSSDYAIFQNCEQCNVDNGCFNHSSPPDECATCALTLPPIASNLTKPVTTPRMLPADEDVVKQLAIPLFRPPKI